MNNNVKNIFDNYPEHVRHKMLALRDMVLDVAKTDPRIGAIEETTKWGEPSYIPSETKSGSTIRMDWKPKTPDKYMLFFNCKTSLISSFREMFGGALDFEKNRAIVLDLNKELPETIIRECIRMGLTYNL